MNKKTVESKYLELIEGSLEVGEAAALREQIEHDPELTKSFQLYKELIDLEQHSSKRKIELNQNFTVKVMERLRTTEKPGLWSIVMKLFDRKHWSFGGVAGAVTAALVLCIAFENAGILEQDFRPSEMPGAKNEEREVNQPPVRLDSAKQVTGLATDQSAQVKTIGPIGAPEPRVERDIATKGGLVMEDLSSPSTSAPNVAGRKSHLENGYLQSDSFGSAILEAEKYGSYKTNKRNSVATDPVSTFSIDVDTGSYTNARRFIRLGQMPPPQSIRVEEFLNYFSYDYPKQTKEPFAVYSEIAPSPLEKGKFLLKLGIKTKDVVESNKPWNLVFLVDVSGSMQSEDKLPLLKQSLKLLTNNMRAGDRISVVTYAGHAATLFEAKTIQDKGEILSKLELLTSGGSTYGSGGIIEAYRIAQKHFISAGENRVVLASDGDFNVGTTSTEELIKLIEEKRKSGVTLTTLGFGTGNYNEALTEQLANNGNGNYFYIDSFKEATKVFQTDLLATIETVAKDVKVQIEFNPEKVSHYRLVGYDNRQLEREDFNNDQIDAGETGAGHVVTVMYELALKDSDYAKQLAGELRYEANKNPTPQAVNGNQEFAFLKIRYKEPAGSESKLLTFPITNEVLRTDMHAASLDFRFASAVMYFAELLRNSQQVSRYTYNDVATLAKQNLGGDKEGYRSEFLQLVQTVGAMIK